MACTRPIPAWKLPSGKLLFTPARGTEAMQVPCGQCIACRLSRSRQWALRCQHEAHMHETNCFLTLTYSDDNLPAGGTLVRKHITDFLKRLRKRISVSIRYFGCGEYGSRLSRPHYHLIIFGYDFPDKVLYKAGKFPLFNDELLSALWSFGFAVIAGFSFESAAYVARYCVKKITGKDADEHYNGRLPEFSCMSLKPGIGYSFFMKHYDDIVNFDKVVSRGGKMSTPPRYYDQLLQGCDYDLYLRNKATRLDNATFIDPWRIQDLDRFNQIKFNNMIRKIEND